MTATVASDENRQLQTQGGSIAGVHNTHYPRVSGRSPGASGPTPPEAAWTARGCGALCKNHKFRNKNNFDMTRNHASDHQWTVYDV